MASSEFLNSIVFWLLYFIDLVHVIYIDDAFVSQLEQKNAFVMLLSSLGKAGWVCFSSVLRSSVTSSAFLTIKVGCGAIFFCLISRC